MMKNKILLISLFLNSWIWGQNYQVAPNKYNLTIKSPDASQLSKFTDIPPSTHTGTTSIIIPIYTIQEGDYTLPISLKYHTSGIKVKEVASKIGLGWSLSIGDIILSKQIFGNQDKGAIPNINQVDGGFEPNTNSGDQNFATIITGFNSFGPENPLKDNKKDTQPDIYSYSVKGSSGDFYFDSTGKIIKIPETDIKIEDYFTLTDNNGNKYFFSEGNQMRTTGGQIPSNDDIITTDFIIKKIILNTGKEIVFEYSSINTPYQYLSNYYKGFSYPVSCIQSKSSEYNEYASLTEVMSENYLTKIIYPEGSVLFTYNNSREDLLNGLSLEKISTYDKANKLIYNYFLNKSYFTTSDTKNINGYPNHTNSITKRLKLNEVKNTVDNSSFKLTYYEENPLPNRLSDATDYLGYSNGKTNNAGIPYFTMEDEVYGLGDDKKPNITYAVSGSLKEIIYPTGGKMKLDYELDDFNFEGPEINVSRQGFMECGNGTIGGREFTVNSTRANIKFKFTFTSPYSPNDDGSGSLPIGSYVVAELLDQNNNILKQFLISKEYEYFIEKKSLYKIRFRKQGSENLDTTKPLPCLMVEWYEVTSENKKYNKSVGGIRVKKITKQENFNNNIIEERYIYTDKNNISTGVFMGDPLNYFYSVKSPDDYNGNYCEKLIVSNSGNFNLATINGKPVVYNKVITERINVNNNEKWKTEDSYYNIGSTNAYNSKVPYLTFVNNQFARGLLIKKEIFDTNNKIVRRIENNYSSDSFFNQKSADYVGQFPQLVIRPYQINIIGIYASLYVNNIPISYTPVFETNRYEITSAWMKNTQTKVTNYLGDKEINEITDYYYDNLYNHLNPVRQKNTLSDLTIEVSLGYAYEKNNQLMIDKNMIGIPLETITSKTIGNNTKIISKVETIYPKTQADADTKTQGLTVPTSMLSYDISNLSSGITEITYDQYDSKGNIQQYTTKAGIPTTIIWGYNQTQPIAKIEGAKLSDIPQSQITAIVNASNEDASDPAKENLLMTALDTFRKNTGTSSYQVSTYTYDPLIGVTSITPPSGIREVYIYDTANRLKEIRQQEVDSSGNITYKTVKEFKYNYKN
ncbi:hypothetical protein AAEU33_14555 [Chryseobacterium sp. Chry.R1]|uniref:hypothetical protein n=1 Tax=Chryseobacterium sp. Chry.R1 TaxID=3139392 RepID=UPI0031F8D4D9